MKTIIAALSVIICQIATAATTYTGAISIPALGLTGVPCYVVIGTAQPITSFSLRTLPLDTDVFGMADPVGHGNIKMAWSAVPRTIEVQSHEFDHLSITNGFKSREQLWHGPSNSLRLGDTNFYYYSATADCSITGFATDPDYVCSSLLTITNAGATTIAFTYPGSVGLGFTDPATTYLTNGWVLQAWFQIGTHVGTNAVIRTFRH